MNREAAASENGNAENEKGKCQLHATFRGWIPFRTRIAAFVYGMSMILFKFSVSLDHITKYNVTSKYHSGHQKYLAYTQSRNLES